MKKLKRVFGSVANLTSGRSSDHASSSGSGSGALTSGRRSVSGSLQATSPQRGSYVSYETRSLDSFTSGQSSGMSPVDSSKNDKHFTKLHKWAAFGDTTKLKKFIKKVEVDARDSEGKTPLHHAAGNGRGDAVLFLLGSKADAEARDHTGATPLLRAVEHSQIHVAQMLLQRRVDVKAVDNQGRTCVHLAARSGAIDLLVLLLDCGGDCDAATKLGRTPLHLACGENQEEVAGTLLRHGANVNVADKENITPLMLAAKVGCVGLVENLLDNGAALDPVDASCWSAADYARFTNHNQLHHRLTTLAQRTGGSSLVPQGLLSVSDESSDPTDPIEGATVAEGEDKATNSHGNNSWSDDSDVISIKEKAKINLAKFLPSSDESGDNTTVPPEDPTTSALGPPKPPRLYTSFSSLASEGDEPETACGAAGEEEGSHKDDNSWKSSSEEEEKPKPKFKSLGLFVRDMDSSDDKGMDSEMLRKSSIHSNTRAGKDELMAELGLSDMKYQSSEEDVSFEEDEKPMLPLEGTLSKVILSRRSSETMEVSPRLFEAHKKTLSPYHQSSSTKNLSPRNTNNESPSSQNSEKSTKHMRKASIGHMSAQNSEHNTSSRRVSICSSSPFRSPKKKSPKKVRAQLRKYSAFDSESDEDASHLQSKRHTSLSPSKKKGSTSTSDELPLSQRGARESQRLNVHIGEVKETSFIQSNLSDEAVRYQTSVNNSSETDSKKEDNVRVSAGGTKGSGKIVSGLVDGSSSFGNVKFASSMATGDILSKEGALGREGTLGRVGTMQEVEEVWEANPSRTPARHSTSSCLNSEDKRKHTSKVSVRSQQSETESEKSNSRTKMRAGSALQRDVANSLRGSGECKESKRRDKDVTDGFKTSLDQDDTAQDVTDEDFASSGVEDLLDPMANDGMPIPVPINLNEGLHSFENGIKLATQKKIQESPTTDPSFKIMKHKTKTASPRETTKQIKAATTSMERSTPPTELKAGVNVSIGKKSKFRSVSSKSPDVRENPGWIQDVRGTVTFSDDEGEGLDATPAWSLEEGEDGASTETEESGHINAELKDALLAPLSSLPDAWDADQLQDLVRELRLKLEKELGRRAASETTLSRIRHQERHTRRLCAKQEETLQQQQQEVTRLNAVIRQMEYQGRSQQDSGRLHEQSVEEWRGRCEQLEEECRSLQAQAQRQDQLADSLILQLQTKDTVNNTLHARLQEVASQTKYVSMKSCQTDDVQVSAIPSQSTHSQTNIVCFSRVEVGTQSDLTAASSDMGMDRKDSVEGMKINSSPVFPKGKEQTKVESAVAETQTEPEEQLWRRVSTMQEVGIQCEGTAVTSTGVQNVPERLSKTSQVQTHARSVHTQTQVHTSPLHVERQVAGTEHSGAYKQLMRNSSCQAAVLCHTAAAQTDPVGLDINAESSRLEKNENTHIHLLTSAVESLLQNFSRNIESSITKAAMSSQTAALEEVSKTIEGHLTRLSSNISTTLQQGSQSGQQETLHQLEDSIQQLQNTLQYQQDIIMRISDDAIDIKSSNLHDVVQEVNSNIQSKLENVGKELNTVQGSQESSKADIGSIVTSLKNLKDSNEKLLQLFSSQLLSNGNSAVSEELSDLKQQLADHLKIIRQVVESGGSAEDSGLSVSKGVMERLDTIEKSLSLSLGKNCTTEDMSDLQLGVRQLSQDIDKKISYLEEGLMAVRGEPKPEIQALEEQLRGLKESTEILANVLRTGASEDNAGLSEALEENFQIMQDQVQRLQQTLMHRINEVSERLNVAEDQQATRLSQQVTEVARQVAGVQSRVMQVQAWVERAENGPPTGDTLDQALVSSLKASSDHTLTSLTQQYYSILQQLETLQREVQHLSSRGIQPTQAPMYGTELQHLKEELREKESSLNQLKTNLKELQDTLRHQRNQMETCQHEAEVQHVQADRVKEQLEIQEAALRESQEMGRKEAARSAEDLARLKEENLRLSTETGRVSASLEVEQQQRKWCEGQLQVLQDSRDAAEMRAQELFAALPPPSLLRTPPTGRDQQEDEAVSKKQEAQRREIEKLEAEKHEIESCLVKQQGQTQHLDLQLREAQASLTLEQHAKADVEVQLKKAQEALSKLQQNLNEARQQQEAASSLEDHKRELEGELQARDSVVETLKSKVEALNKEKLQLKQDIITMKGEKFSHELLRQEKEFSEEIQRKTEAQLYDLQRKIPQEYVTRTSLGLMQKELESKYQRELSTKLSELQHSLDKQSKQHESLIQNREAREQQLREELGRKSDEIVRLNTRLSLGEEREDSWRVRHDRLLAVYQQGAAPHLITADASLDHTLRSKKLSQDSLSITLQEIDQHLKTPLASSTLLGRMSPPAGIQLGGVGGGGGVDSYHHTHAHALDRTLQKYLSQSERFLVPDEKPQARISPLQPPLPGGLPTLDQSCQEYVDLLKKKYGL